MPTLGVGSLARFGLWATRPCGLTASSTLTCSAPVGAAATARSILAARALGRGSNDTAVILSRPSDACAPSCELM